MPVINPLYDAVGNLIVAAVATAGSYGSLTGAPSIPSAVFKQVTVSGQSTIVAASVSDTLDLRAGANITLTATTSGNALTIAGSASAGQLPVGYIFISTSSDDPAVALGYGTWTALGAGKVLVGYQSGSADFGTGGQTGGATGIAAAGTVSKPAFVGESYTPSGTNDVSLFVAAGTNAASVASGSVSVEWPTGVPVFSGTAHQHGLPFFSTGATGISFLATSIFGVGATQTGALRVTVTATGPIVRTTAGTGQVALSQTATGAGVISWPATAPSAVLKNVTAAAQIFTGATVSVSGPVFTGVAKDVAGTVSKPTFTGDITSVLQPYLVCYFFERTA